MGVSLDVSLYLAWLIPSSFSFLASCYVIYYIVVKNPKLRTQVFHQLTILLAIADLIQSGNWFIGVKYTAHYHQCAAQEYLLQLGLVLKATICVVISTVAMYVVRTHKNPQHHIVIKLTALALLVPFGLIICSLYFHSARLYCNTEIPHYNDSSPTTQRSILSYWTTAVYIYLCCGVNILLLSTIEFKLRLIRSTLASSAVSSHSNSRTDSTASTSNNKSMTSLPSQTAPSVNTKMMRLVSRLRIYPLIFVVMWMPEVVTLLIILTTGTDQLTLRHVANACGGLIGLATAASYFHYQNPASGASSSAQTKSRSQLTSAGSGVSEGSYISRVRGSVRLQMRPSEQDRQRLHDSSSAMSSDAGSEEVDEPQTSHVSNSIDGREEVDEV
mmetsp:Transcript_34864/g.65012  ORF Transcript_34864/g.65012 Transcript_34864/m.65012 type:complete len:386 (-) Transcript_34864:303-1460(-)